MMVKENILKYNAQVPRYTSYPTAPHFSEVAAGDYVRALESVGSRESVSIYVHVPFCSEMCWYCGCHTTATRKYAPVEDYITLLIREIRFVADMVGKKLKVSHIHFGGGSPTMLQPKDFHGVMDALRGGFFCRGGR